MVKGLANSWRRHLFHLLSIFHWQPFWTGTVNNLARPCSGSRFKKDSHIQMEGREWKERKRKRKGKKKKNHAQAGNMWNRTWQRLSRTISNLYTYKLLDDLKNILSIIYPFSKCWILEPSKKVLWTWLLILS